MFELHSQEDAEIDDNAELSEFSSQDDADARHSAAEPGAEGHAADVPAAEFDAEGPAPVEEDATEAVGTWWEKVVQRVGAGPLCAEVRKCEGDSAIQVGRINKLGAKSLKATCKNKNHKGCSCWVTVRNDLSEEDLLNALTEWVAHGLTDSLEAHQSRSQLVKERFGMRVRRAR